jgi:TET-associated glycosyltransferase-like protein
MREDFGAFILTHGRPDRVYTYDSLLKHGYTGKIYLVVDDEDKTKEEYIKRFGAERVLLFSKSEIVKTFDEGDNFNDRRAIIYARNACFDLAEQVGCRYFIQLDDDYRRFEHRFNDRQEYVWLGVYDLDAVLTALLEYYISIPALSVAMGQAGDHLGGAGGSYAQTVKTLRKAMNTFICSTDRRFQFVGRINEDVNTYTALSRRGELFLTILALSIIPTITQSNAGGMTELYLDSGTYVKSFYSVMYSPGCVKVSEMASTYRRIHHKIDWNAAAVKIVHQKHRKDGAPRASTETERAA